MDKNIFSINENNYTSILNGEKMITGDMEEPYLFGGEFFSYIAIMPIIPQYENQNNYLLLIDALFKKFIYFYKKNGIDFIYISVYRYSVTYNTNSISSFGRALNL